MAAHRRVFESALPSTQKLTALALLDHWSKTAQTFPSILRLVEWTSLSEKTVRRSLKGLEATGAVVIAARKGRVSVYDLSPLSSLPPAINPGHSDQTTQPSPVSLTGLGPVTLTAPPAATPVREGTRSGHSVPEVRSERAGGPVTVTYEETQEEIHEETHEDTRRQPRSERPDGQRDRTSIQAFCERMKLNPYDATFLQPQKRPEILAVAEELHAAAGWAPPRLMDYPKDTGLVALVDLYAAGYTQDQLMRVAKHLPTTDWWQGTDGPRPVKRNRGVFSLSPTAVTSALNELSGPQMSPERAKEAKLRKLRESLTHLQRYRKGEQAKRELPEEFVCMEDPALRQAEVRLLAEFQAIGGTVRRRTNA